MKPIAATRHSPWHPAEVPLINTGRLAALQRAGLSAARIDKMRFVGEAVAMVIAESVAAAKDGAEPLSSTTSRCRA